MIESLSQKRNLIGIIAAFVLGFAESNDDCGMTYDEDVESPRSVAYDRGRNIGCKVNGWKNLILHAEKMEE